MPQYDFGGEDFGRSIAAGFAQRHRRQEEELKQQHETEKVIGDAAGADLSAQRLYQMGVLSHEDMAKFQQAPLRGKQSMIGEVVNSYHLQLAQREQDRADEAAKRAEEERQYERNFEPYATTVQVPTGQQTIGTGPYGHPVSVPETETYPAIRKSPRGEFDIQFHAPAKVQATRAADTGNVLGYGLPGSFGSVTYDKPGVPVPAEGTPIFDPQSGDLWGVWSGGRFIPKPRPGQTQDLIDLFAPPDQQPGGGTVAPPQTTIGPSPVPGQTGVPGAPVAGGKIRVRGPNGQTGTANAGQQLPPGWSQIP